jgi:hypothetical protein
MSFIHPIEEVCPEFVNQAKVRIMESVGYLG